MTSGYLFAVIVIINIIYTNAANDKNIVRARLESCPGCSLNRLADIKKFVYEDIPTYENVEWKKISGAPPEFLFLNEADEVVERHLLSQLSRKECNELLKSKGFKQNKSKEL